MKEIQTFHILCKGLVFHRNKFLIYKGNDLEFFVTLENMGGRINRSEFIKDALKRGVMEEFGIDLNNTEHSLDLFDINQRDEGEYGLDDKTQIVEIYYKIIIPDHVAINLKFDDMRNFEWIGETTNIDDIPRLIASRNSVYKKAQREL